ncbi:MAG: alpha-L-glutamate ligase-like protein [Sphingomonadales bacterium]
MLGTWLNLNKAGVIGLNRRNVAFINELNPRRRMRRGDDKTITKELAEKAGIPVPELYGVISNWYDMGSLRERLKQPGGLVIKPANGSQGNGILLISRPMASGSYQLANGRRTSFEDVQFHVNNIASGMYSLSGQPDKAMLEYRVRFDTVFDAISFKGVPDIRIIVVRGIPVAAMLRLPTAQSDGKANLHKGGVGVGLDLRSGETQTGMQNGAVVAKPPDTGNSLAGITVPHWDQMLTMAARAYDVTGLGYLGADIVLDKERGPLLLELNARPGLAIQVALRSGLGHILDAAMDADSQDKDAAQRVEMGQALAA